MEGPCPKRKNFSPKQEKGSYEFAEGFRRIKKFPMLGFEDPSYMVTHPSTDEAQCCLTSATGRQLRQQLSTTHAPPPPSDKYSISISACHSIMAANSILMFESYIYFKSF